MDWGTLYEGEAWLQILCCSFRKRCLWSRRASPLAQQWHLTTRAVIADSRHMEAFSAATVMRGHLHNVPLINAKCLLLYLDCHLLSSDCQLTSLYPFPFVSLVDQRQQSSGKAMYPVNTMHVDQANGCYFRFLYGFQWRRNNKLFNFLSREIE